MPSAASLIVIGLVCGAVLVRREWGDSRRRCSPSTFCESASSACRSRRRSSHSRRKCSRSSPCRSCSNMCSGASAFETGLLMTPWPLALGVVAPFAGRLADRGPGRAGRRCRPGDLRCRTVRLVALGRSAEHLTSPGEWRCAASASACSSRPTTARSSARRRGIARARRVGCWRRRGCSARPTGAVGWRRLSPAGVGSAPVLLAASGPWRLDRRGAEPAAPALAADGAVGRSAGDDPRLSDCLGQAGRYL